MAPPSMRPRSVQVGFTYLGLLFFVAISAAALATLGQRWSLAVQREKERELEFRGGEIARAIDAYVRAGLQLRPNQPPVLPSSIDELLEDRRGPRPLHHLRRAYADPFTGQADWVLLPAPGRPGQFAALHSRSEQALLRRLDGLDRPALARDWVFRAAGAPAPVSRPGGDRP